MVVAWQAEATVCNCTDMTPRGGRPELTDAEVMTAVDYIISTVNPERNTP
ncbi:MAG: hypothetical protein ACLGGY_01440 [Gammaproteobacteria bacterium]